MIKKQKRFVTYKELVQQNKRELTREEMKQIEDKLEKRLMNQSSQSK